LNLKIDGPCFPQALSQGHGICTGVFRQAIKYLKERHQDNNVLHQGGIAWLVPEMSYDGTVDRDERHRVEKTLLEYGG